MCFFSEENNLSLLLNLKKNELLNIYRFFCRKSTQLMLVRRIRSTIEYGREILDFEKNWTFSG